jgi:hypothetical protein
MTNRGEDSENDCLLVRLAIINRTIYLGRQAERQPDRTIAGMACDLSSHRLHSAVVVISGGIISSSYV